MEISRNQPSFPGGSGVGSAGGAGRRPSGAAELAGAERRVATGLLLFLIVSLVAGTGLLGLVAYDLALAAGPPEPIAAATTSPAPTASAVPAEAVATSAPQPSAAPATPTAPPAEPGSCREGLVDGGFEAGEGWEIVLTAYSAGYVNQPAEYVANPVRSGTGAMRLGIAEGRNVYSYSAVDQAVTIPAEATAARLSFWYLPVSGQRDDDVQYLLVLKESGGYDVLLWELRSAAEWERLEFALDGYRGQRVTLHWGVRNDGRGDRTVMYLDDVSLALCFGVTPTPYAGE